MSKRSKSGFTFLEIAVSITLMVLLIAMLMPAVNQHVSNQRLKKFGITLAGNISLARQEAKKLGLDPQYSGETTSSAAPPGKTLVNYRVCKGSNIIVVSDVSEDEITFGFQGFSAFDQIDQGIHLDFFPGSQPTTTTITITPTPTGLMWAPEALPPLGRPYEITQTTPPFLSILFLPDGTLLRSGTITLSNGKKSFSLTLLSSGNVQYKEY